MTKRIACQKCGTLWHPYLIDAKPNPNDPEQFTVLEGPCCYGPGWVPLGAPDQDYPREEFDRALESHKKATEK